MNRFHFLKKIAAGLGVAVAAPQILQAAEQPLAPKVRPNETAIMIYDEYIAGFRYHKGPKNIDTIQVDDEVKLVREANNKYDEFAVSIHWQEKKIGFVRMDDNIVIANLIDNDLPLFAKISEIKKDAETWEQMALSVYLLYPCK
jgi:HIRAN domain